MDVGEKFVTGTRCFTDLTIPLDIEVDQNMHRNLGHSIREIHYHTFNSRNVYIFAVLLNGQVQIFEQIRNLSDDSSVRFKKVILPELAGKKIDVDYQEYSYKEKNTLNFKRTSSNTVHAKSMETSVSNLTHLELFPHHSLFVEIVKQRYGFSFVLQT